MWWDSFCEAMDEMCSKHAGFTLAAIIIFAIWIAILCVNYITVILGLLIIAVFTIPIIWIAIVIVKTIFNHSIRK